MEPAKPTSPFQPGPPKDRDGASRVPPILIGCAVLLVLLGVATVILIVKLPSLVEWSFGRMEQSIMAKLPPDVTPEERQRLEAAFDGAVQAISTGKADPDKLKRLQTVMMQLGQPNRTLLKEDVRDLTEALEGAAGKKPPPTAPAAPAAPSP